MTSYLSVTNMSFTMSLHQFEGDTWIIHIFLYIILPKWVVILLVEANCLFKCTLDFIPEFYSTLSNTLSIQASNKKTTLYQSLFDPTL